ncbi:MAG: hypothetical protein WCL60_15135 [Methylococcales bacterium]
MKLLLDTNVVSELRKAKTAKINPNVKAMADNIAPTDLYLSVVTLLDLRDEVMKWVVANHNELIEEWKKWHP